MEGRYMMPAQQDPSMYAAAAATYGALPNLWQPPIASNPSELQERDNDVVIDYHHIMGIFAPFLRSLLR